MDKVDLKIDWATHEAAKYAVEHWHYSKTLPPPPLVYIGVWEGKFIGCIVFSRGACLNLLKPYGLKQTEGCELVRVALTVHVSSVTKIIKIAILFLKKTNPGLRLIVSFADPMHGHLGGIYQGGNWIYTGETSPDYFHIDKKGKRWHSRQVRKTGVPVKQYGAYRKTPDPKNMTLVNTLGKHRYLMPLDKEMAKQIESLRKPYPKRPTKAISSDQEESGGAVPTRTLQSNSGDV